jgi:hypothetical protein
MMDWRLLLPLVVVALVGLLLLARRVNPKASEVASDELPYRLNPALLTDAERSFFLTLQHALDQRYLLFAKVRLADLLVIPAGTPRRQGHFNRISAKHVDIVGCDLRSFAPMFAIELDDSSHQRASRQTRDVFVEDALRAAGLPLIRIAASRTYSLPDLSDLVAAALEPPRR